MQLALVIIGWAAMLCLWAFVVGPLVEPACQAPGGFGFLPGLLVAMFAAPAFFLVNGAVYGVWRAASRGSPASRTATFFWFSPFILASCALLISVMNWSMSGTCLAWTLALAIPWIATPVLVRPAAG